MTFKAPKTILVTGCAGFIGSNFVKQFKEKFPKTRIVGIDNLSTIGGPSLPDVEFIFYRNTILDERKLDEIFGKYKPEYVFHFAAIPRVAFSLEHPYSTAEANILGTVMLLAKSKEYKVRRFIYSSSSSVYGDAQKLPTKESENPPQPRSPYALQKYAGELFCKMFADLFGLDTICLRYFTVFGPGQYGQSSYSTLICAWLESLYFPKRKKAFIEGDGNQSRDFCYVDNVVSANILAMKSRKKFKGEFFNIASGGRIAVNTVKKMIEELSGKKLNLQKRPKRIGDVRHTYADISKARKWLNYKPVINFEEGLKRTINWFETRK
jgi:UDP-glucose 4-epimerase